ncbi:putative zinc finger protein [Schistosoma mansoni]|uniref:putative zinc finger protein n=1 Tax=Schistosoma mansoni TaxID=6183 RepID=UPI00022DBF5D|nr:putative zinc finger protein [Schistosoma mansoni]|eukprot:XP_018648886.1 putative zinc finger protein [Schistosoma mansoni]
MNSEFVGISAVRNGESGPTVVMKNQLSDSTRCVLNSALSELDDTPGVPSMTNCPQETKKKGTKLSSKHQNVSKTDELSTRPQPPCSVRLIDEEERVLFEDADVLAWHLGCPADRTVKLIAIVGNTGDGKSHTLNQAFCGGADVFVTSPSQATCTIGIWAAYLPKEGYLLIDTEGLLGASPNPNRQRRLLLKVFALADVVIYRTMSDRLHSDMFTFLAGCKRCFFRTFSVSSTNNNTCTDRLGSAEPSNERMSTLSSRFLTERLVAMRRNANAFSSLVYVGTQTKVPPTNFQPLASMVAKKIRDISVRAPRKLVHIFHILQALNTRFSSDLPCSSPTFVEEYFTCPCKCISCGVRCCLSVNHTSNNVGHKAEYVGSNGVSTSPCRYEPTLQNKLYFCKLCYAYGQKTMMVPKSGESNTNALSAVVKYLWAGYVLECPRHGTIYRSRGYWSGNVEPEMNPQVHWEIVHVWQGEKSILSGTHPVSQLLLDGLTVVSSQVSQLAGPPARRLGDLIADSVAPRYWQPNSSIKACAVCKVEFQGSSDDSVCSRSSLMRQKSTTDKKHSTLSAGDDSPQKDKASTGKDNSILNRSSSFSDSLNKEKSSTKPLKPFIDDLSKHHCRACGRGVCAKCSTGRLPVPDQGYGSDGVRVCDQCYDARLQDKVIDSKTRVSGMNYNSQINNNSLTGRKVIEMLSATADYIAPIYTGPKELVKSLARPDYWQPDDQCVSCNVCSAPFGSRLTIHHCRSCGQGVCGFCSQHYQPVPKRGLDFPSRVCDRCYQPNLKDYETSHRPTVSEHRSLDLAGNVPNQQMQQRKRNTQYNNPNVNTAHKKNSEG